MDEDCCAWYGITFNNVTGHILKLDLRNPYGSSDEWSLTGELRSSLISLKHLQYLDLSFNNFGGITIPAFFGSFKQLQYLNLSSAGFGGGLPHQLGNLTRLQYLDLHYSSLSIDNAQWLSYLSSLKYLDLGETQSVDGVQLIQSLNMIPSIIEIHLQSINDIDLSIPLVNFTSLSVLDLTDNFMITSIPSWVFNLSSLTFLNLHANNIHGSIPTAIEKLSFLEYLDLSGNPLELGDDAVTTSLRKLCHLESLIFSSINISRDLSMLDEIFSGCVKNSLKSLDLGETGVEGQLPDWLWGLKDLVSVYLSGNSISGSIPESIGRLSSLQQFSLAHNHLSGTIPESLGDLYLL